VNNELRRKVWPLLLGCDENDNERESKSEINTQHEYHDQIKKDIVRSMHHFDVTRQYSSDRRQREQEALERILNAIFGSSSNMGHLHYTQGFHDMCSVFYIVCGERLGAKLSENLAKRHMRDLVRDMKVFDVVYQFILKLLFPLLNLSDHQLYEKCFSADDVSSMFALSWIITWFAHNIQVFNDITRLYDFFLSTHPLMPLYFSVSLIVNGCRKQLLLLAADDADSDNDGGGLDQGKLHQFFQQYDWNINYDQVIHEADKLFERYPPHDLYRQYFIDEIANLPADSPFLAKSVYEVDENLKTEYSGHKLSNIWNYQNPKFWRNLIITTSICVVFVSVWKQMTPPDEFSSVN